MDDLDKIGDGFWHLLDLSAVELFNLSYYENIFSGNEVDRNTLSSETFITTDSVDIVFEVGRQIVINNQRDLLDISTTGQNIGGDQNTGRTRSELLYNQVTLTLVHITVHSRNGEVAGSELGGKPIDLPAGIAEDNGFCDGNGLVQIAEGLQLPLLLLNIGIELLDTFEGKLILEQDTDGIVHKVGGDLEHILRHGGRKEDNLGGLRKELKDIVDLLSETALDKR